MKNKSHWKCLTLSFFFSLISLSFTEDGEKKVYIKERVNV